jgi:conjugal transfer pilus assembly protein TraV
MKQNSKSFIIYIMMVLFMCGCHSVFNPYDDAFQCPEINEGACTSIPDAYDQSVSGKSLVDPECTECRDQSLQQNTDPPVSPPMESPHSLYQENKFKKLNSLIQSEAPPLVVPPEVVRILVLSYTGMENEMFGYRYIYFFATQPSWLLSAGAGNGGY